MHISYTKTNHELSLIYIYILSYESGVWNICYWSFNLIQVINSYNFVILGLFRIKNLALWHSVEQIPATHIFVDINVNKNEQPSGGSIYFINPAMC